MTLEERDRLRRRVKEVRPEVEGKQLYRYRAYMSSALTAQCPQERDELCTTLERLFEEVFDKLGVFLYLPHLWSDPGHNATMPAPDVNILDRLRIAESDFVVVCADHPSFGVGQEFEIAQAMGLPILLYRRQGLTVSRMLLGGAGVVGREALDVVGIEYSSFEDLCTQLKIRTSEVIAALPAVDRQPVPNFSERLAETLRSMGLSIEEAAARIGFTPQFLSHLLTPRVDLSRLVQRWELLPLARDVDVSKFTNPGLWVIRRICRALDIRVHDLVEEEFSADFAEEDTSRRALESQLSVVAAEKNASHRAFLAAQQRVRSRREIAARVKSVAEARVICMRLLDE